MRKLAVFAVALCLFAADPWQSKPYTQWSEKDVQKILTSSPWAHSVSVGTGQQAGYQGMPDLGSGAGRPGGMSSPGGGPGMTPTGQEAPRDRTAGTIPSSGDAASFNLTVVWQSAIPVKQALVIRRFGAEGASSVDAKKFLDEHPGYVIAVYGVTPNLVHPPINKDQILERTLLGAKGKDAVRATGLMISAEKATEWIFVFPKTAAFALEDKEVEFTTRLGSAEVRSKFRLKDMVVNGALQL